MAPWLEGASMGLPRGRGPRPGGRRQGLLTASLAAQAEGFTVNLGVAWPALMIWVLVS